MGNITRVNGTQVKSPNTWDTGFSISGNSINSNVSLVPTSDSFFSSLLQAPGATAPRVVTGTTPRDNTRRLTALPRITGTTVEEIERNIIVAEPQAEKQLKWLRWALHDRNVRYETGRFDRFAPEDSLGQERYRQFLLFIQDISQLLEGRRLTVTTTRDNRDIRGPLSVLINNSTCAWHDILTSSRERLGQYLTLCRQIVEARRSNNKPINMETITGFMSNVRNARSRWGRDTEFTVTWDDTIYNALAGMTSRLHEHGIEPTDNHFFVFGTCARHLLGRAVLAENTKDARESRTRFLNDGINPVVDKIVNLSQRLERLKPGLSQNFFLAILTCSPNIEDFNRNSDLLMKYVEGLAMQGENNINWGLIYLAWSFNGGLRPSESMVNSLLKLHEYGGFLNIRSLGSARHFRSDGDITGQRGFEQMLSDLVGSFDEPGFRNNAPVAVVTVPYSSQYTGQRGFPVLFDGHMGQPIPKLLRQGYRVLIHEVRTDEQILHAVRRARTITNRKPDLLVLAGHGSQGSIIDVGSILHEEKTEILNPQEVAAIIRRTNTPAAALRGNAQRWQVISPSGHRIRPEALVLRHYGDHDIISGIAGEMSQRSRVILFSCEAGQNPPIRMPSMGRLFAFHGLDTFAATDSFSKISAMQFDSDNTLTGVTFWNSETHTNVPTRFFRAER